MARDFSACCFVRGVGNLATVDAQAERVRMLHDAMTQADSTLTLA